MDNKNYKLQVRENRFGEKEAITFMPEKWSKKDQSTVSGVYRKLVQIDKPGLYAIEVSNANKTKEIRGENREGKWLKITKKEKRSGGGSGW